MLSINSGSFLVLALWVSSHVVDALSSDTLYERHLTRRGRRVARAQASPSPVQTYALDPNAAYLSCYTQEINAGTLTNTAVSQFMTGNGPMLQCDYDQAGTCVYSAMSGILSFGGATCPPTQPFVSKQGYKTQCETTCVGNGINGFTASVTQGNIACVGNLPLIGGAPGQTVNTYCVFDTNTGAFQRGIADGSRLGDCTGISVRQANPRSCLSF